jgi:hypothetical protein
MKRRFNTAGPCVPELHYMIPADRRLPEAPGLVDQMGYFVVHAPRQTGKTTALRALADHLTASGRYAAVYFSCEAAQAPGDDFATSERIFVANLRAAGEALAPELRPPLFPDSPPGDRLHAGLAAWARACPRPLVLLIDEIDALWGPSVMTVLQQLRSGFPDRPAAYPSSVILCGLRDVRDYKAASGGDPARVGTSSPFNVKVKSLRLGDFTRDEVRELYGQHTAATGQVFLEEALDRVFELTGGQPWLVNALAQEIIEEMAVPPDQPITRAHCERAKERLILARATHLDSLVAKLHEPRVRGVMGPLLAGTFIRGGDSYDDDLQYVRDLGLAARDNPVRVANPIYREVIARVLASSAEAQVVVEPRSFVLPDGRLAMRRILREFAAFWREHGDVLAAGMSYHEVAPQLVLMAFLQRVVNGGGYVDREYGVGRGRIDLLVRWPYTKPDGTRAVQRRALELKVRRDGEPDPLQKGLAQLDGYLAQLRLKRGTLVIFDRRAAAKPIAKRTRFEEAVTRSGRKVRVLRG